MNKLYSFNSSQFKNGRAVNNMVISNTMLIISSFILVVFMMKVIYAKSMSLNKLSARVFNFVNSASTFLMSFFIVL